MLGFDFAECNSATFLNLLSRKRHDDVIEPIDDVQSFHSCPYRIEGSHGRQAAFSPTDARSHRLRA